MAKKILLFGFMLFFLQIFALEGMIIKTSDASYRDRWEKTLGKTAPRIAGAGHVFKGQQFFVGVAVSDFQNGKDNLSEINFNIKITDPRGKIYLEKKNLSVLKRKIEYKNYVQLSDEFVSLSFGFNDAFGTYLIETEISDKISGEKRTLTSEIQLTPIPDYESVKISEKNTFSEWMGNYYRHQEPEKALPYFIFFTKSELADREDTMLSVLSFFREIFRNNPYLFTQFSEAYNNSPEKTKMLLTVLMYQSVEKEAFNKYFPEKAMQDLMKESEFPNIYGEITTPIYLDMLWAEFYAGGKQKPILQLVKSLENARFKGALKNFKNSKKSASDRENATKDAIYEAAAWSLESHFRTDELVLNYANWIMANEELTDLQRRELGLILLKFNR